jgi:TPR repeat protein
MLATGAGVPKDLAGAAKWMRQAMADTSQSPKTREATRKVLEAVEKALANEQGYQAGKRIFSMTPDR